MAQRIINPKQVKFVDFARMNIILAAFSFYFVTRNDTENKAKKNKKNFAVLTNIIEVYAIKQKRWATRSN